MQTEYFAHFGVPVVLLTVLFKWSAILSAAAWTSSAGSTKEMTSAAAAMPIRRSSMRSARGSVSSFSENHGSSCSARLRHTCPRISVHSARVTQRLTLMRVLKSDRVESSSCASRRLMSIPGVSRLGEAWQLRVFMNSAAAVRPPRYDTNSFLPSFHAYIHDLVGYRVS